MKIQNSALAGVTMALRYHPGQTATADAYGTFDVPDEDAEFLLSTSGWRIFDAARQSRIDAVSQQHEAAHEASRVHEVALQTQRREQIAAEEAARAAAVIVQADEKAATAAYKEAKALESAPPPPAVKAAVDVSRDGPNLDSLDRNGLILVAEEYGVGIDRRWSEQRIRETLDAALYSDEEAKE